MDRHLKRHDDSTGASNLQVTASIIRHRRTQISLRFGVSGNVEELNLPPFEKIRRGDRLWEETCFELFVRGTENRAYCEFNVAPTGEWAAYSFDDYRTGMRAVENLDVSALRVETREEKFELFLSMDLGPAAPHMRIADWRVGMSAILSGTKGTKSYWALAHPPGKPDFHHSDCFVLELSAEDPS